MSFNYFTTKNDFMGWFCIIRIKTHLPLLRDGLLMTFHILVFLHTISMMKQVHTFMARSRVSKSCVMAELCFHRLV